MVITSFLASGKAKSGFIPKQRLMESTVWNTTTQIVCHKHQNILEKGPLLVVEGEKGGDLAAELHSGFQICLNPEPPSRVTCDR